MGQSVDTGSLINSVPLSLVPIVDVPPWLKAPELGCEGADPELFFPDSYEALYDEQIKEAKALCFACPVYSLCLEWALDRPFLEGVWAATTPLDRRRIRMARKSKAAA